MKKLSEAQQQHLFQLYICADRQQPETQALVAAGLAESGSGKFGDFARISSKGVEYVRKLAPAEFLERETTAIRRKLWAPFNAASEVKSSSAVLVPPAMNDTPPSEAAPIPNALRVATGTKVTYYPLTTVLKNVEQTRVRTANKLFRPYPMAASAQDQEAV